MSRNIALENSFYLQFTNSGLTDFTMYLFNGGGELKTPFKTSYVWGYDNLPVTNLTNSVFTNNTTVLILDELTNVISSVNMLIGQTIDDYLLSANPLTDINGNVGIIDIQENGSGNYDIRIGGLPSVSKINFSPDPSVTAVPSRGTFALSNPFITIQSTIPIEEIENSENGSAYRILTVDLYSEQSEQLLQTILYGNKNANGNRVLYTASPIIDPYQIGVSIFDAEVEGMIIDTETVFRYTIRANSKIRMTFNYVKGDAELMRGLNQAFIQRLIMEYNAEKKILDQDRMKQIIIQ